MRSAAIRRGAAIMGDDPGCVCVGQPVDGQSMVRISPSAASFATKASISLRRTRLPRVDFRDHAKWLSLAVIRARISRKAPAIGSSIQNLPCLSRQWRTDLPARPVITGRSSVAGIGRRAGCLCARAPCQAARRACGARTCRNGGRAVGRACSRPCAPHRPRWRRVR